MIVAKSVRSSGLANLKVSLGCSAFPFRLELGFFWPLLSLKNLQRDFGSHSLFSIRDELDHLALIPQSVGQR